MPGDLPRQNHPLPKALDDAAATKFLPAAQTQRRMLIRVVCEVLLRPGLRVGELINLDAEASVQIGAGTGCTSRSANCTTTATCRCTPTSSG